MSMVVTGSTALLIERDAVIKEHAALLTFARKIMECWPEGDVEGSYVQEVAVECGLLIPCDCGMVEGCSKEEPDDTCLKLSPMMEGDT